MTGLPPLSPLSEWDDQYLLRLWHRDECDYCTMSASVFGHVPSYCDVCGTDRSSDYALWREIERRGLADDVWNWIDAE